MNMTDATSGNFDRAISARVVSERVFLAGAALLFATTAAATLVWCNARPAVAQPVARKRPGLRTNMVAIDLPGTMTH